MKNNIRVLLLILTVLFIGTALTIRNTVTETNVLELDTEYLSKNLSKRENIIDEIFNDSLLLKTFKNSERYPLQLKDISNKYVEENIYLYLYKNNKPIFWSTNIFVPPTATEFYDHTSFVRSHNFSLVVKQKIIDDEIKVLALIPIEKSYPTSVYHKKNKLYHFLDAENLELANFSDSENIRNIYSNDNSLLFSVKLKEGKFNNIYTQLQLLCWLLASICFITTITSVCYSLAKNKKPIKSILYLASILFLLRIFDLETNWISSLSSLDIFLPEHYSHNYFTPNIWAYLANTLCIFWLILYSINIKKYIIFSTKLKQSKLSIICYYLLITLLYLIYIQTFDQLATLITNSSNYKKDLAQFIYSNELSLVHISIYSINIISLILITDFSLKIVEQFQLKSITALNLQLIILIQFILLNSSQDNFSIITILIGTLIIIRIFNKIIFPDINRSIHIITLIIIALITNIKFSEASKTALIEQMKFTIAAIQSEDDIEAIRKFIEIEKSISNDNQIKKLLQLSQESKNEDYITEYIKKKYLTGYISNYNFVGYYFFNEEPLGNYDPEVLNVFREKVIDESIKVDQTNLFYKSQVTGIGVYEYFSIIRLSFNENESATLIFDFTNNTNSNEIVYTLTGEKSILTNFQKSEEDSYAIYRNGELISQKGKYIYPNKDNQIPQKLNEFITYESNDEYYHLSYKSNDNETIIVSKPRQPFWQFIAIASVVFLLLYSLSFLTNFCRHVIPRYLNREFRLRYLNYQIRDIYNTVRYSTRIQTLVISSVVIVIIISGLITFFSVRLQSQNTRENNRLKLITDIAKKLEIKTLTDNSNDQIEYLTQLMNALTNVVVTDFNLYDKNGLLFYTTQPKIYEQNLLSKYINPGALIELNVLKKQEAHKKETIADLNFESVYATIKNNNYSTLAYVSIPYYNAQEIEDNNRDILLNTIFNIYTIIIIIFAFLSIYIANKITAPLQLIRKKLTMTNLNEKSNEPLYWEKNDEIGLLIKDYNYMLIKLEENAKQLRNAERESAWREMAKQVAHEIKNPLTPMKLGIQQLSRSFNENDPKLRERFEKVSISFIEQIDALAHIANEFSAFAKLPDTNLIPIDLDKEIVQSIEVFKHSNNTYIEFMNYTDLNSITVLGDRDQTLRAFNNLLKNAIEATSSKRKHLIKIGVDLIEADWIKISVKDNGDGIPHELRSNIFKPNFTTKSSGTGLGLAFVKQTIDGMGGRIYYESIIDIGTVFYIELPIYKEKNKVQ